MNKINIIGQGAVHKYYFIISLKNKWLQTQTDCLRGWEMFFCCFSTWWQIIFRSWIDCVDPFAVLHLSPLYTIFCPLWTFWASLVVWVPFQWTLSGFSLLASSRSSLESPRGNLVLTSIHARKPALSLGPLCLQEASDMAHLSSKTVTFKPFLTLTYSKK